MKTKYFLPFQSRWVNDLSPLKIVEKSRQVGLSSTTAFSALKRVACQGARLDVYVSSRDEAQAQLFVEDALRWAGILGIGAEASGQMLFDRETGTSAYVLSCANGRRIYSLSSNPNALAGKRGHVILDEFALHDDQSLLYRVAKPLTTWGGQMEIISTHRGISTVFNDVIRSVVEKGNPMGWSHHKVTLQDAVNDGLLDRINAKTGRSETPEQFLTRTHAECLDEEQWLQEYCCVP